MKKSGILNAPLSALIARLGHTETVVIADCGLPIPRTTPVVDLALVMGIPRFADVFDALAKEIVIEHATIATQTPSEIRDLLPQDITPTEVDHEEIKKLLTDAAFVIRTGETTPYANVILHCGVAF